MLEQKPLQEVTCNICEGKSTGCLLPHVMRKHFKFINSFLIEPCRWIAIRFRVLAKLAMRLRRVMVPARFKPFGRVYNVAFEEIHVCSIDLYLKVYASNTGFACRLPALCNFPVLYLSDLISSNFICCAVYFRKLCCTLAFSWLSCICPRKVVGAGILMNMIRHYYKTIHFDSAVSNQESQAAYNYIL